MEVTEFKKPNTNVYTNEGGKTVVVCYKTSIVTFDDNEIVLNTGGHWTRTTQIRMNNVSEHYDLGYRVHQKKSGEWSVKYQGEIYPYTTEQIQLNRKVGTVVPIGK